LSTLAGIGVFRTVRFLTGIRAIEALSPALYRAGKLHRLPTSYSALSNLTGYTAAPVAAVLAEKSVRHLLGSQEDWSSQGLLRELGANAVTYGLIFGNARLAQRLGNRIGIKKESVAEKALIGLGVLGGATLSTKTNEWLGYPSPGYLRDPNPDAALIADSAATMAHFFLARYLSNKIGGDNFIGKETRQFRHYFGGFAVSLPPN
jgi:hypothetical protein